MAELARNEVTISSASRDKREAKRVGSEDAQGERRARVVNDRDTALLDERGRRKRNGATAQMHSGIQDSADHETRASLGLNQARATNGRRRPVDWHQSRRNPANETFKGTVGRI